MSKRFIIILLISILITPIASSKNFNIIIISKNTDNPTDYNALIAGGYIHGLESGMIGSICKFDKDTIILAELQLLDVQKYESTGIILNPVGDTITTLNFASFNRSKIDTVLFLKKANSLFKEKSYQEALYNYVKYIQHTSCDDDSINKNIKKCEKEIKKYKKKRFKRKERHIKKKNLKTYKALGRYYFGEGNYGASKEYFDLVLKIDKNDKLAFGFSKLIKAVTGFTDEDFYYINPEDTSLIEYSKDCSIIPSPTDYPQPDDFVKVEINPEMIDYSIPKYPPFEMINGVNGVVWVRSLVNKRGEVIKSVIHKSSNNVNLDLAAIEASYYNSFKPGIHDGKPVNVWVSYQVNFKM